MIKNILFAIGMVGAAASSLHGASIVQGMSFSFDKSDNQKFFGPTYGGGTDYVNESTQTTNSTFNKFNPALGALTDVKLSWIIDGGQEWAYSWDIDFNSYIGSGMEGINYYRFRAQVGFSFNAQNAGFLAGDDDTGSYGMWEVPYPEWVGVNTKDDREHEYSSNSSFLYDDEYWQDFEGTGTLTASGIGVWETSVFADTDPTESTMVGLSHSCWFDVDLSLTYFYTPVGGISVAPEPGSLSLILFAFSGLKRSRKASNV